MDNIKEKQYIKNSIYLNLQKKELSELMSKSMKEENKMPKQYKLKLINKDIINGYLDPQLNEKIIQILNNQNKKTSEFNDQDINNIIKNINVENKKDRESLVEELTLEFLFPEELKVNNLKFPTNFYIITEERFNKIFGNMKNLTDFKTYNAYLGKEGIFMWIVGDMISIESEGQTKDNKKALYYIENNDIDDLNINKIILYKNEEELNEQLGKIFEEGKENYFENRNIIKDELGSYNMINDGKIIGKYINVIKNIKEKNNQMQNSVGESIESERIENEYERIKEKEGLINIFLPYLLICFAKIEKLKTGLEELEKNNKNFKGLLQKLLKIIKSVNTNKDNKNNKTIQEIEKSIFKFEDEFLKKDFILNFSYKNDNKLEAFKNLIEMLLNEFHQEIYVEDKLEPKKKFEDLKKSTIIFDLFFGLKTINKKKKFFNTIELKTDDTGNQNVNIEDLLIHYKFKQEELVLLFPNVLILLITDDRNFLKLPLDFNLKYDNKDNNQYKLKSCIQILGNQPYSFIINDKSKNFYKVSFDYDENNTFLSKFENSNIDEINGKLSKSNYNIFFYEIDENNSEITNQISNSSDNQ
jgi:hypothetical protein